MADLIWFPPIRGCSCAVCRRRRHELQKADTLEAEWSDLNKLLEEAIKEMPPPRWG